MKLWILVIYNHSRWDDGTIIEFKMAPERPELGASMLDNFRWVEYPGHTLADVEAGAMAHGGRLEKDTKLIDWQADAVSDEPLAMLYQTTTKKGNEKRSLWDKLLGR